MNFYFNILVRDFHFSNTFFLLKLLSLWLCIMRSFVLYCIINRRLQEVFKTEQRMALPLSCVKGRCAVLGVKDYPLYRPYGFDDNDIYVCESQYSTRARLFKKIKVRFVRILTSTLISVLKND